jgi:hypothetical protein
LAGKFRQICVPVGGPTGTGKYFIQIICDPDCRLKRAELEVVETSKLEPEKFLGKRLVVVKEEDDDETEKFQKEEMRISNDS